MSEVWAWQVWFKLRKVQVTHPISWILENCALSFFSRLFFEVLEMKALQAVATPVIGGWKWQPPPGQDGQRPLPRGRGRVVGWCMGGVGTEGAGQDIRAAHLVEAKPRPSRLPEHVSARMTWLCWPGLVA